MAPPLLSVRLADQRFSCLFKKTAKIKREEISAGCRAKIAGVPKAARVFLTMQQARAPSFYHKESPGLPAFEVNLLKFGRIQEEINMARGGFGSPMGGMNMNNLMKQAQKMQKQMLEAQEAMGEKTLEVTAGGGAIKIVINGKKEIQELKISPEVVDADDVEMLEDLVLSAVNEAVRQAEEMYTSEINKITGGAGGGLF